MSNVKPVVLVNRTNADFRVDITHSIEKFRATGVVDKKTGEVTVVEVPYESKAIDVASHIIVPPSIGLDVDDPPGFAVLKTSTYKKLTDPENGHPDFAKTWASPRRGVVEVLEGEAAQNFLEAWGVDLKTHKVY